jgi:hypothetical protein
MPWSKTKTTSLLSRVLSLVVLPWRNPGYPLLLLLLLLLAVFWCARVPALQCTCSCSGLCENGGFLICGAWGSAGT